MPFLLTRRPDRPAAAQTRSQPRALNGLLAFDALMAAALGQNAARTLNTRTLRLRRPVLVEQHSAEPLRVCFKQNTHTCTLTA